MLLTTADGSVGINRASRPAGIVPPDQEAAVLAAVRAALLAIRADDEPVVTGFLEPVARGRVQPGGATTGDLFPLLRPGFLTSARPAEDIVMPARSSGNHGFAPTRRDMLAVLAAWGPRIPAGSEWPRASALDVVPTALDLLGLPADPTLPGRSLLGGAPSRPSDRRNPFGPGALVSNGERTIGMDVAREGVAEGRRRRRLVLFALGGGGLAALVLFALRLGPAAPGVDRGTVFVDTVRRGEMLLSVRGPGTLVPVEVRRVAAGSSGRVARVHALPGVRVEPETAILTLENPSLVQELTAAELELAAAEADLDDRRVQLRRQVLNQRSVLASVEAEARQAALDAEADAQIYAEGIIGRITLEDSESAASELKTRARHEAERLQLAEAVAAAELAAEEARVARLRAVFDLKRELVARLEVRAGIAGVLQEVSAEAGQQVAEGDNLARVAEPARLKAELRIAEVQAKDIEVGQSARVDTRNGIVSGRVIRVEPAVRDGAVTVDVAFTEDLPRGARSELSVDGLVEIERLDDVLHVGRPAFGQEGDEVELFRLTGAGDDAVRVRVLLGKASVNTVEIREGLSEGDTVILSDPSAWEGHDRIRLR